MCGSKRLPDPFQALDSPGKATKISGPIGRYFLENGIFHSTALDRLVEQQRAHNRKAFFGRWA
jgi:hypothetical protein